MPGGLTTSTPISPLDAATRYARDLPDNATVAVALSGGGDSVGLLAALCEAPCFRTGLLKLAAITIDHGLRSESAGEAAAMADFCQALSIPHLILPWEGDKPTSGLSEAARQARYRLLAEGVERLGADFLVTAHTLDDQLETVEMRRQRNDTSPRGLAGIAPAALFFGRFAVHRPFLGVRRADIRTLLRKRGIAWFDDPSNDNPRYERVRVRQSGQFALDIEAIAAAAGCRVAAAEKAAAYIDNDVRMPLPLLFALSLPDDDDAGNLVLATLIAVAGGQTHLPGHEQLERLRLALQTKSAVSLGRTVIDRGKGALYIGRDRRNLPSLIITPGESVDWDGRFRVTGNPGTTAAIEPSVVEEPGKGVPSRVARRAIATLPNCADQAHARSDMWAVPLLAPFETVLTSFDRAVCDALCRLLGRPLFPCFLGSGLETSPTSGYKEIGVDFGRAPIGLSTEIL